MSDDAAALLLNTWHETGDVHQVTNGMLKTLQKRMKRAPLSDESISSVPALTPGLLATMPTTMP
jgi:hypothetical protein